MSARPLRVAQWGTGNIGTRALREVIRHPDLELVGVRVYDRGKVGVDAATLSGSPGTTGVRATDDPSSIRALAADCVLYMPRVLELDEVVALLEAGTNVVTTRGEFFDAGGRLEQQARRRVLAACDHGGSSIYSTGSSPGFITDALPFALLSLQRRVELIEIDEYADLSQRDSPHLLFEQMGFGRPCGSPGPSPRRVPPRGVPARTATRSRERRDMSSTSGRPSASSLRQGRRSSIRAGEIAAGTVAAQRTVLTGLRDGVDVVRFRANWYCTTDVEPAWDLRPTGWRVQVHGDAALDVHIGFPVPTEELGDFTPALTANRPVNAVRAVCATPPGIVSTAHLPPLTPGP